MNAATPNEYLSASSLGPSSDSYLQALLKSTANASACEIAILIIGAKATFKAVAAFGTKPPMGALTARGFIKRIAALGPDEVLALDPAAAGSDLSDKDLFWIATPKTRRFLVATRIVDRDGKSLGALVLCHSEPRARLSTAQSYVILMQAAEFGAILQQNAPAPGQPHAGAPARANASSDASVPAQTSVPPKSGVSAKASVPPKAGVAKHAATHAGGIAHGGLTPERLRLLESVVINANDAVLITEAEPIDLPGPRIVYCNPAFERTTGYSAAEVLGKTPRLLQAPGINRKSLAKLKEALRKWRPVEVELLNRRKDGTEFWVEVSIVPVADEKGWYTHWVSIQRDVSDRKRIEAQLVYEAFHDRLTDLHNRAYFMDRLEAVLGEVSQKGKNTLLFIDLDDFKLVNDSLGHLAGDTLLITMSERLKKCLGPNDIVARVGGDEFAILLPDNGLDDGIAIADRIILSLSQPILISGQNVFPSCSIGITQAVGCHLKPADLLRNADIAMYEAKKLGTGGYVVFADDMHETVRKALAFQADLRQAIGKKEFFLVYQQICDANTGDITGVEALIRWQHATGGLIAPTVFIPIAEKIGMICEIGRWVLRTACEQLASLNKRFGQTGLVMSVNVSGDELRDPGFVDNLKSVIAKTAIDPTRLQLEITESVFLRQPEVIGTILAAVRTLGVKIALDDFGTGFSSLSYIDQYEIDTIKIDRSFVARMLTQRRTLVIIETIIRLGQLLDLQIVAEGVETENQLVALKRLVCGHVQGYLLAKPMTSVDLISVMTVASKRRTPRSRQLARV